MLNAILLVINKAEQSVRELIRNNCSHNNAEEGS